MPWQLRRGDGIRSVSTKLQERTGFKFLQTPVDWAELVVSEARSVHCSGCNMAATARNQARRFIIPVFIGLLLFSERLNEIWSPCQ